MKANSALGCVSRSTASRIQESDYSLYVAAVRPHLEHCIQSRAPLYRKGTDKLE